MGPFLGFVVFEFVGAQPVFVSVTEDHTSGVVSADAPKNWPPWS